MILLFVCSVISFLAFAFAFHSVTASSIKSFTAPGECTVYFEEAGKYEVAPADWLSNDAYLPEGLVVRVKRQGAKAESSVEKIGNSKAGVRFAFDAKPGSYRIQAKGTDKQRNLIVTEPVKSTFVRAIMLAAVGAIFLVIAFVVAMRGVLKQSPDAEATEG